MKRSRRLEKSGRRGRKENLGKAGESRRDLQRRQVSEVGWGGGRWRGVKSSVTVRSTEHCSTARLFARAPIQRLIRTIISLLLKWGLR